MQSKSIIGLAVKTTPLYQLYIYMPAFAPTG